MQKGSQQAESKSLPEEVFLRCHPCIFRQTKAPVIPAGACTDLFTEFFFKHLRQGG